MNARPTAENGIRTCCTAFALDTVCVVSDPCQLHDCNDVDSGDASGCYCDPERVTSPESGDAS